MISYGIKLFKSEAVSLSAIRNKEDAAINVLVFLKSMYNSNYHDPNEPFYGFYYPDLHRLVWGDEDKSIHSLSIPWELRIDECMRQGIPNHKDIEWKYEYYDELLYLFREVKEHDILNGSIEGFIDIYSEMLESFNINSIIDQHNLWVLFTSLYSYEPGYIRYDYDPENANGHVHPCYHLDINYCKRGTYKIGLWENMTIDGFTDFLNLSTDCYYASKIGGLRNR